LGKSLLVTGFPMIDRTADKNNLGNFGHFAMRTQGVRRDGSAALDLCYVAAGRYDGFWELDLNKWDLAAGCLIVQEAGGKVTSADGSPEFLGSRPSVLAANPAMHAILLEGLLNLSNSE
jgi:myo-inositol-1(or 4)-monophosphatase